MIQEKDDFTQGRILPKFFRFVLPVLGALLLQAAYGATDLAVVGWFGDKTGTAAVGTGSAVMQLVTVIIAGVTMGATVVIGQLLGERKPEDAGRAIGSSVWLFGGLAVILTILMELLTEPLVRLMNAPEEAFLQTVTYVRICSAGIVLITAYNGISGVFRGLGNSRLPLLFVAIAAAFNVAGDFILVGAFRCRHCYGCGAGAERGSVPSHYSAAPNDVYHEPCKYAPGQKADPPDSPCGNPDCPAGRIGASFFPSDQLRGQRHRD